MTGYIKKNNARVAIDTVFYTDKDRHKMYPTKGYIAKDVTTQAGITGTPTAINRNSSRDFSIRDSLQSGSFANSSNIWMSNAFSRNSAQHNWQSYDISGTSAPTVDNDRNVLFSSNAGNFGGTPAIRGNTVWVKRRQDARNALTAYNLAGTGRPTVDTGNSLTLPTSILPADTTYIFYSTFASFVYENTLWAIVTAHDSSTSSNSGWIRALDITNPASPTRATSKDITPPVGIFETGVHTLPMMFGSIVGIKYNERVFLFQLSGNVPSAIGSINFSSWDTGNHYGVSSGKEVWLFNNTTHMATAYIVAGLTVSSGGTSKRLVEWYDKSSSLPTITGFTATPNEIDEDASPPTNITLTWNTSGTVTRQTLTDLHRNANVPLSGNHRAVVARPQQTTVYSLVARNNFGSTSARITVPVFKDPVISSLTVQYTTDPFSPHGATVYLNWTVSGKPFPTLSADHGIGVITPRHTNLQTGVGRIAHTFAGPDNFNITLTATNVQANNQRVSVTRSVSVTIP